MENEQEEQIDHKAEDCFYCDGSGFISLIDYDGPGLDDEDNCDCECHGIR